MKGTLLRAAFLLLLGQTVLAQEDVTEAQPIEQQEITYEELATGLANFTVVDIRRRADVVEAGQIPGSHIVPLEELEAALSLPEEDFLTTYGFPKPKKDDNNLILTCRTAEKVHEGNAILVAKGYTKHRLYVGSYQDWVDNGGDIIKPGTPFEASNSTVTETAETETTAPTTVPESATNVPDSATANSTIPKEFIIF